MNCQVKCQEIIISQAIVREFGGDFIFISTSICLHNILQRHSKRYTRMGIQWLLVIILFGEHEQIGFGNNLHTFIYWKMLIFIQSKNCVFTLF